MHFHKFSDFIFASGCNDGHYVLNQKNSAIKKELGQCYGSRLVTLRITDTVEKNSEEISEKTESLSIQNQKSSKLHCCDYR